MVVKDTKKEVKKETKVKVEKPKAATKKVVQRKVVVENYDADGLVLGRLATQVAQKLLQGAEVNVYNAEKAIITGSPKAIVEDYKLRFTYRNKGNPEKSTPKYPKLPHMVLKNAIVRMLPSSSKRGRECERRLKVYVGNDEKVVCKNIEVAKLKQGLKYIELSDMCKRLGAKW